MGALISRRRAKSKPRSTSTQATECSIRESLAACQLHESTGAVRGTGKAAVTAPSIGDGLVPTSKSSSRETAIAVRTSIGEHRKVKTKRRSSKKDKASHGKNRSTQFDFVSLDLELTPTAASSTGPAENKAMQKNRVKKSVTLPGVEPRKSRTLLPATKHDDRVKSRSIRYLAETEGSSVNHLGTLSTITEATAENHEHAREDENCNITEHSEIQAPSERCTLQEVSMEYPDSAGEDMGSDSKPSAGNQTPAKKTVHYRDDCIPRTDPPTRCLPTETTKQELTVSLEEIMQANIPCPVEVMEVAAVTGQPGCMTQSLPPPGGYHACWNHTPPLQNGQEDLIIENNCPEDELVEDTLDWNVDDRVRSPSDPRSSATEWVKLKG